MTTATHITWKDLSPTPVQPVAIVDNDMAIDRFSISIPAARHAWLLSPANLVQLETLADIGRKFRYLGIDYAIEFTELARRRRAERQDEYQRTHDGARQHMVTDAGARCSPSGSAWDRCHPRSSGTWPSWSRCCGPVSASK